MIPLLSECITVSIDCIKKEDMKQPQVTRLHRIKMMLLFKMCEECPPVDGELSANLYPHLLNLDVSSYLCQ